MRWQVKAVIQMVLSVVPFGEKLNHFLQLLRGSYRDDNVRAQLAAPVNRIARLNQRFPLQDKVVMEIGTGWSARCSVLLALMGTARIHSYDHVRHLRFEQVRKALELLTGYLEELAETSGVDIGFLRKRHLEMTSATDLPALLEAARISYYAPADARNTGLSNGSVDLVFSHAVYEHVSVDMLHGLAKESIRILRPDGASYHLIGPGDHYAQQDKRIGAVNFLKYSDRFWNFISGNKIAYQNRLRESQFIDIFESHGAKVEILRHSFHESDIELLKTMRLDKQFVGLAPEDLAINTTEMLFHVPPTDSAERGQQGESATM